MEYNLYWGDMHCNIVGYHTAEEREKNIEQAESVFQEAQGYLDFFPIAYYPFYYYFKNGFLIESFKHNPTFETHWEKLRQLVKQYNQNGQFVTFMGYEWHGDRERYGDHNVFFFNDDANMCTDTTLEGLYDYLRQEKGLAIPHHTAYRVYQRGKDWNVLDESLSPFAEVFSGHGVSERINNSRRMRNTDMAPRESGGTIQDGLARGHHFGLIASPDNQDNFAGQWDRGLAAVYAKELTREGIWDAFQNRRVYGVTGDRIILEFDLNGNAMGSILGEVSKADLTIKVKGCDALDAVEIVRNNRVMYTHNHQQYFDVADEATDGTIRFKQRMSVGFGPRNFGPESHKWRGTLTISAGAILNVDKTFTCAGQRVWQEGDRQYQFDLTTRGREHSQGLIFEIEAKKSDIMDFEINGQHFVRTVEAALLESKSLPFLEESKHLIQDTFGLSEMDIENHEMYYHHAYKAKFHRAVPSNHYETTIKWTDSTLLPGESYYYIRVSQMNGQMAWSSPIWINEEQPCKKDIN